jgi:betaine-aldehyde dehydrogenase
MLYIHGSKQAASSNEIFTSINPATGEVIAQLPVANTHDVNTAVASAQTGFAVWSQTPAQERGRIFRRAGELICQRTKAIAELEVQDTGKPITEALSDIESTANTLNYFAGLASTLHGEHYDLGSAFFYTRREPLGVCAGIGAWNYPFSIAVWKLAPALAAGNSMIFKPAELTPLTANVLAEILTEAGLPKGVFNVVHGPASTGQCLSQHPHIAKISITGEVSTGKAVMRDAASTLKHVMMELGGKSPLIIFADCDVETAVNAALAANFYTQGEICSNGTRVFVHRKLHAAFIEKLIPRMQAIRVGDPMDPQTQMGALISEEHLLRVLGYVDNGQREGAHLLCGGKRLGSRGFFMAPAVFDACMDNMTLVQEEIFGPVMSVLTFDDEEEVLARANNTTYGLAAGVFTRDLQRAHRVAARLQTGICWINNYNITPNAMPYGGYKHSGIGRENGVVSLEQYTQLKSVYVELGEMPKVF